MCINQTLIKRVPTCFDEPCILPLQPWTNLTYENFLFSTQHQPDWCDVTRTNIMRLFHCLWSSIVSVYYRYQVWQGSDCVPGTCVPSKTNTGPGLICWMISNPAVVLDVCGKEGDERVDRTITFAALVFHISFTGTNGHDVVTSIQKRYRHINCLYTSICKDVFLTH